MEIIVLYIMIAGLCAFLAYLINSTPLAAIMGGLLGPLGVLIACFLEKPKKQGTR